MAIDYQEKFLSIAIEIGDKNSESAAYGNLGVVYCSLAKYEEAIHRIHKAWSEHGVEAF